MRKRFASLIALTALLCTVSAMRRFGSTGSGHMYGHLRAKVGSSPPPRTAQAFIGPQSRPASRAYQWPSLQTRQAEEHERAPTTLDTGRAGCLPWPCGEWMRVTQDRDNPSGSHKGSDKWAWDFGDGSVGWPVMAARDGVVAIVETGYETGSGCASCPWYTANRIVIDYGDGTAGLYMHLAEETQPPLRVGDPVRAGVDRIGYADTTGWATGPHLHYAVQGWDRSWNGDAGRWYQPSLEALFTDPNVPNGNPTTNGGANRDGWYSSGNCQTVDDPRLSLKIGSLLRNREVSIELRRTKGFGQYVAAFQTSSTTDETGRIESLPLHGIRPGMYHILVKPVGWLRRQRSNVSLASGHNSLSMETDWLTGNPRNGGVWAGDASGDNKVNIFDLDLLHKDWQSNRPRSDFNGDGTVDMTDIGYFLDSFGCEGDGGLLADDVQSQTQLHSDRGSLGLVLPGGSGRESPSAARAGDVISVELQFDTSQLPVGGIDAVIDYDHCVLEPLVEQIAHGGLLDTYAVVNLTNKLQYSVHRSLSAGGDPSPPIVGTGSLAVIPFQVVAGTTRPTRIALRFKPDASTESNMAEDDSFVEILGSVTNAILAVTGVPERPSREANILRPTTGGYINRNLSVIEAEASDPCAGIQKVDFSILYDYEWHHVGSDMDPSDGWAVRWDASQVSDQMISVKAFAGDMAGNGVTTPVNHCIALDREPPSVSDISFKPTVAASGELVTIRVHSSDNLAGIKGINAYVDPSPDGSTPWGSWDLVGSLPARSGDIVWDATGCAPGVHRVVLSLEDMAGNHTYWPLPGEEEFTYHLVAPTDRHDVYLPLVVRTH